MRQPPRLSAPRAHIRIVRPDGEDGYLSSSLCTARQTTPSCSPVYQWLRPDPRRTLPRTRVLVLRLTFREAERLLYSVFPQEEAVVAGHRETVLTSALGVALYGALVKHGFFRVTQNVQGIRMVRTDMSRFSLTYPCIESDQEIRLFERVRMIHRTDSVWRSSTGTWVQLLHAAHEAAYRGELRPRGDWESAQAFARQQRRAAYESRKVKARNALLSSPLFPSMRLTLTRAHATSLLRVLTVTHANVTAAARLSELQYHIGVRMVRLLRKRGVFLVVNVRGQPVDNPYLRFREDAFDQCLFRLTTDVSEEGFETLTEPRLRTMYLRHHSHYRLSVLLQASGEE